jgi:hypothetical protein
MHITRKRFLDEEGFANGANPHLRCHPGIAEAQ